MKTGNTMKTEKSPMAQAYSEKRLNVFKKLKTKPTDWRMASVMNFRAHRRVTKKGEVVYDWIPVYKIPGGYTNPFGLDSDQSENKRCQLCDKKIVYNGVIVNENTNQFLVVGDTCMDEYYSDDDKKMLLDLMVQFKEKFVMDLLNAEKKKLTDLVEQKAKEIRLPYAFYSVCLKNRYMTWNKAKFVKFIIMWSHSCSLVGYEPDLYLMGFKNHVRNLKNRIASIFGVNGAICHKFNVLYGDQNWQKLRNDGDNVSAILPECDKMRIKIQHMELDELREMVVGCDALRSKWFSIPIHSDDRREWATDASLVYGYF
jgi:hypothetical protein